jgi:CubicO group peptidase (beta-lactamase class C family)
MWSRATWARRRFVRCAVALCLLSGFTACSGAAPRPGPTQPPRDACDFTATERSDLGARISTDLTTAMAGSDTDRFRDLRAVLVSVCGFTVVERYQRSQPQDHHNVASVTKSVVSALVGIAIHDGLIRDVDQSVGELLPERRAAMTPAVAALTLKQLLTMTAGLDVDRSDYAPSPWEQGSDEVATILREGIQQSPGAFGYSSASAHLVGAIVARAAGRSLLEYAREKLFEPLAIATTPVFAPVLDSSYVVPGYDAAGFAWPVDHQGAHRGDSWLRLTPSDLLKLGQLYLDNGRAGGRQVVPSDWVRDSTVQHVRTNAGPAGEGYGYLWWVTTADGLPAFTAAGFGGQLVEVVPSQHLVAVFVTELSVPKIRDGSQVVRVDARAYADLVSRLVAPKLP